MELAITPPQPLAVGTNHSAFPGLTRDAEGTLELVWRQGTDHAATRDGQLRRAVSRDDGATYAESTHLRIPPPDLRDPSISYARGAQHLTWFTGTSTNPGTGAFDQREWGPAVRIDPNLPVAAITSPVVDLPDNRLGTVFYGRQAGEAVDTSFMAWTVNHGLSWTTNRILNGIGANHAYNEPYLVRDDADIHVFFRSGTTAIGMRTSTDSGRTGSWGPVRDVLTNATGRPTALRTAEGVLLLVYRRLPTRAAAVAVSTDHGATWQDGPVLLEPPADSPNGMTYAAMAQIGPSAVHVVFGMEATATESDLYGTVVTLVPATAVTDIAVIAATATGEAGDES